VDSLAEQILSLFPSFFRVESSSIAVNTSGLRTLVRTRDTILLSLNLADERFTKLRTSFSLASDSKIAQISLFISLASDPKITPPTPTTSDADDKKEPREPSVFNPCQRRRTGEKRRDDPTA